MKTKTLMKKVIEDVKHRKVFLVHRLKESILK
jgi:hypothetical protein